MSDRFTGTMLTKLLTQGGLPEDPAKAFGRMSEETDKALLDILKKVNELAGTSADASATGSTLSGLGGALSSAIKGMKYGLDVIYVSSDTLSILPGAVEVNGELVVCPNAMAITSGMPNFPAAGSWAFVTMEKGGTHRLFPATGTAAQRPTDNCFQWTGGGVGFLDLGKQGYYYDPARRIIGAVHKVSAAVWYIINLRAGANEYGTDLYGTYNALNYGQKIYDPNLWVDLNLTSPLAGAALGTSAIRRSGDSFRLRLAFTINPATIANGTTIATFTAITKVNGSAALAPHRCSAACDTTTVRYSLGLDIYLGAGTIVAYFHDAIALAGSVANVNGFYSDITMAIW